MKYCGFFRPCSAYCARADTHPFGASGWCTGWCIGWRYRHQRCARANTHFSAIDTHFPPRPKCTSVHASRSDANQQACRRTPGTIRYDPIASDAIRCTALRSVSVLCNRASSSAAANRLGATPRVVREWCGSGPGFEREWCGSGAGKVVRERRGSGAGVAREWHGSGTGVVRERRCGSGAGGARELRA